MYPNTSKIGGVGPVALSFPYAVQSDGTRLFVPDYSNNRVLIWNTMPTADGTPPNVVLGQPDMTSNTPNYGGISAAALDDPEGVFSDGTRVYEPG